MEGLLETQRQLMQAMEKLYSNFKKDGPDRKTPANIKRNLEILDRYYLEFQSNHEQLATYQADHPYYDENHMEKTSKFYMEVRQKILQYQPPQPEVKSILRPATPLAGTSTSSDYQPTEQQQTSQPGLQHHLTINKANNGNLSKLDEMYKKQKSNLKALERAINNTILENLNEKWEFEDALRTIQARWTAVDTLHWELDSELTSEDQQYENTYFLFEGKYNQIKKDINSKMWAVSYQEKAAPKMEVPIFSGSYQQWTSFKDLFSEAIHKNKSIPDAQKMQLLKSKVKGEAEKLIQHLQISSENYKTCWEILDHRYNNKRLIFSSHINTLLSLPNIQQQSASAIKKLYDTTKECLHGVKNLGVDTSNWDPLVVHLLTQKLDNESHNDYFEYLGQPRELPVLSEFLEFLELRFMTLESARRRQDVAKSNQQPVTQKTHNYKGSPGSQNKPFINHTTAKTFPPVFRNKQNIKCPLCDEHHGIFQCKTFIEATPQSKRQMTRDLKLCENCLYDHKGKECFSEKRCSKCDSNHNTLLHGAYASSYRASNTHSNKGEPSQQKQVTHVSQDCVTEIILATAQIKVLSADGTYQTMRALVDQGSQTSLISENAAQKLGLPRQRCKGVIFGIGTKENNCKGVLSITASSLHSNYTFSTDVLIMKTLVTNLPQRSFNKPAWNHLEGIQLADPDFNISRPVDILLGADIYSNIILSGIIRESENQPIAQQSRLGWIICGNLKSYQCNVVLHDLEDMSRFWTVEDIAENSTVITSEEQYCLEQYKAETKRQEDGRYIVRLPLKPDFKENLGESKQKAVAQFLQLERKIQKNEELSEAYRNFMREYIALGHMQLCDRTGNTSSGCYLPYHAVQRVESTTTSFRVVFNGSAKTSTGNSLNDLMYSGPNLQADLMSLIMKWRQYKIAFSADIEKMFRAILIHEEDQIYQKIIWRETADQPLREYALSTVTYGTKAAPFLAMNTLKQLAQDEGHLFPEAAKILEKDFYMDDLLSGHHSIETAKNLQTDLINLLKAGGFNLRKWCSNHNELLKEVDTANKDQSGFDFKQKESTETLGLRWNPQEDTFTFQLKIETSTSKPAAKRSLLSDISKIFDPLGWLCPTTTKLKLLFQSVWQQQLAWDDQLPQENEDEWSKTKKDLENINSIKVQRWLNSQEHDDIELHGFCDSSERSYACIIYVKISSKNQSTNHPASVVISSAKSR